MLAQFVYLILLRGGGRFVVIAPDAGYAVGAMNEWIGEDYRDHEPLAVECLGLAQGNRREMQVLCRQYDPF